MVAPLPTILEGRQTYRFWSPKFNIKVPVLANDLSQALAIAQKTDGTITKGNLLSTDAGLKVLPREGRHNVAADPQPKIPPRDGRKPGWNAPPKPIVAPRTSGPAFAPLGGKQAASPARKKAAARKARA